MARMCSNVDLRAPDGPMIETNSPDFMSKSMRRRTYVFAGPYEKAFSTFRRLIILSLQDRSPWRRAEHLQLRGGWRLLLLLRSRRPTSGQSCPRVARDRRR